jgi:hypothetical protein
MEPEEYEVEKHKFEDVSKSDLFLAEHYEELFYLPPKELAMAINAMNEDELLQFNQTISNGYGMNVDLMMDKLDELNKYCNVNFIFIEAIWLTSICDAFMSIYNIDKDKYKETFLKLIRKIKELSTDKDKSRKEHEDYEKTINDLLKGNVQSDSLSIKIGVVFIAYPQFKTDFKILKTTPKRKPFITETDDGLQWTYSKKSLSQYFGYMTKLGKKNVNWKVIENLFNETDLKNSFSINGKERTKDAKDYELLLKVLKKYPRP